MAGLFNIEKASEEVFDFVCGPCHVDGEVLQAKGYCSDCQDYLCDICLKHHLRSKPSRHHILLDENSMPKDKKATSTHAADTCTERCPKHSGNIIEYFCESHNFLGCTKCFISDNHRKCEGVVCIEDATAGLYESQEYKTYIGKIEQIMKQFSKSHSIQQENDEKIRLYSIRAKQEITIFKTSINEFLDKLENGINKQVSQMEDLQTLKCVSTFQHFFKLDDEIKTIERTDEKTRNLGQRCNSYINMKRYQQKLKQLEDWVENINEEIKVLEYNFKPDVNLQNIIKDTKTFGKLVTSKEVKVPSISTNQNQNLFNLMTSLNKDNVVLEGGGQFEEGQAYMIRDKSGQSHEMIWRQGHFVPPPEENTRSCYKCGKSGHMSRKCPDLRGGGRSRRSGGVERTCYNCGGDDHSTGDCLGEIRSRGRGGHRVKQCYSCGKTGHMSRDCPNPSN